MDNKFIVSNSSMIEPLSNLIASEFLDSPLIKYFTDNDDTQYEILQIFFNRLLELYKDIGVTYVTSIDLEGTFSLVNFKNKENSNLNIIFDSLPSLFKISSKVSIIDISNKLLDSKDILVKVKEFLSSLDKYLFLSSIAYDKSKPYKDEFLKAMLEFVVKESLDKNIKILVETETMQMISLYKSFGFKLNKNFKINNNTTIYFLEFN